MESQINIMGECGLDSSGLEWGPVKESYEYMAMNLWIA
jgi:hypothetical protein